MDTVGDVVAQARERSGTALRLPARETPYSYREFATNAWKAGNLLAHHGVAGGRCSVAVGPGSPAADHPDRTGRLVDTAAPVLAALGGLLLGAPVDLDPPAAVGGRALVAPAGRLADFDAEPGCSRLAYGDRPAAASVAHFERDCWSENPVEPPERVAPDDPALLAGETHTHRDLLAATEAVVADAGLTAGDAVRVLARVDTPGGFVAGLLAPLSAGATVLAGDAGGDDPALVVGEGGLDPAGVV